jgi:hypothetical protein
VAVGRIKLGGFMKLDDGLIGRWTFDADCKDHSNSGVVGRAMNVAIDGAPPGGPRKTAARFNGQDSYIHIENHPALHLGTDDFSIAVWIHTDGKACDVVGDILSQFDPNARRGFGLSVVTNTGGPSTGQANYRNLHLGVDRGRMDAEWTDEGRPGNAVKVNALHASEGSLYAGTFEAGVDETGHLWRYEGRGGWQDLGATPDGSNAVLSVAYYDGALYCGSGRYNSRGSALGSPQNATPGGNVYRVESDGVWVDCGHPGVEGATPEEVEVEGYETGKADTAGSLTVYRGELYTTCYYRRGVFKYEGGKRWKHIGLNKRMLSFVVYKGELYALINGGEVFRYLGDEAWEDCGTPTGSTQTYSAAIYAGDLYVGTWPVGDVQRYLGGQAWRTMGRAGEEKEVMGMAVYNQKLYVGTLPLAHVFRMDNDGLTFVGNVDDTPNVTYRRVWSMAVYDGKLFCGTLPSGRVWSLGAGAMATCDRALPGGWRHAAALRQGNRLKLYLDGQCVATSRTFHAADYNLTQNAPLKIGFGGHTYFDGWMSDLRLYRRALTEEEIKALAVKSQ